MEAMIENQVKITRPLFMEWCNAAKTEEYKKSLKKFTIIMAVILAGALALFAYLGMGPILILAETALFIFVYLYLAFISPHSRNKNRYKALVKDACGTPERTIQFFEDYFTVTTESGNVKEFDCANVEEIKETENLYIVVIVDADIDVLLDKKGFVKGDIDQVRKLCQLY